MAERARVEEALQRSEERFRRALEIDTVGVIFWGKELTITNCNNAFLRMSGLSRQEALGKSWRELTPPEFHPTCERTIADYVATGKAPATEKQYFRKDGSRWWALFAAEKLSDNEAIEFVVDISDRKQAEEALRSSEERLRTVLRSTGVGLWLQDLSSGRVAWDAPTRELFFLASGEEPTVELFWSRVHPNDRDRVRSEADSAIREDRMFATDFRVLDPRKGRVRWIHAEGRVVRDEQGKPARFDGINYDVTERREFQAELERLVEERTTRLQEMVGELEHFSHSITHDLKAPLRAMRGFAEMAVRVGGGREAKPFLEKISTAAERMDGLIRDALNYSRAVRQDLPLEDVDTGTLLIGILDSYPQFQPWKAHIRVEGRLPVVLGNEAGLTQCFSNLLGNSIKFVRSNQLPEIRVWSETREGWSRVWVADQGIGIPKELQPRVFDMFSRGSRDYEGTGIGLALVRKVVQRMGGTVGVESEEGKGSRFWIELKTGTVQSSQEPRAPQPTARGSGTVLYVEDEESDAAFMQHAFAEQGLEPALRVVGDGRAAIQYLSGTGTFANRKEYPLPAVVLLDLNLPLVPGFDVLKWMRNHPDFAKTPVVIFSSSNREDDRARARELGANEFLAKPSSGLEFGWVVEELKEKWMVRQAG